MQLNRKRVVRQAVTAMTAALLGPGAVAAELSKIESSVLLYSETSRVKAAEGVASASWNLPGGRTLGLKLTYDGLTGASPNGAAPSSRIQTFTRPSGRGQYTVPAGETPLDDTFHDSRVAFDASFSQPLNRLTTLSLGGHVSSEYDYLSVGGQVGLSRDFNRKNTTLDLSGAFSFDKITPEGGIPTPFDTMLARENDEPENEEDDDDGDNDDRRGGGSDTKQVFDAVLGLTQVVDRRTITQINYSLGYVSGYQADPFKVLSVCESPLAASAGDPISYLYETRPDSRLKQALYARVRRYVSGSTIDASYRLYWDDWGITSHMVDLFYRQGLGRGHALQPHVRWYHQSSADFYHPFLVDGQTLPQHASADYRLAEFDAYTVGLQYFVPLGKRVQLSIAGEYYSQLGDKSPPEAFGSLRNVDLFPNLKAFMIRTGVTLDF